MKQIGGQDTKPEKTPSDESVHGEAAEHGHTGEGAASAMAHMIKQGEKHRRQSGDGGELTSQG